MLVVSLPPSGAEATLDDAPDVAGRIAVSRGSLPGLEIGGPDAFDILTEATAVTRAYEDVEPGTADDPVAFGPACLFAFGGSVGLTPTEIRDYTLAAGTTAILTYPRSATDDGGVTHTRAELIAEASDRAFVTTGVRPFPAAEVATYPAGVTTNIAPNALTQGVRSIAHGEFVAIDPDWGQPLVRDADGRVIMAVRSTGTGQVVLSGEFESFTDAVLEDVATYGLGPVPAQDHDNHRLIANLCVEPRAGVIDGWGAGGQGMLGPDYVGTQTSSRSNVDFGGHVPDDIAVTWNASFVLDDGMVYGIGRDAFTGQLGDGGPDENNPRATPAPVVREDGCAPEEPCSLVPLDNIVQIDGGLQSAAALDAQGRVWRWGYLDVDGGGLEETQYAVPILNEDGTPFDDVVSFDVGYRNITMIRSDGTAWHVGEIQDTPASGCAVTYEGSANGTTVSPYPVQILAGDPATDCAVSTSFPAPVVKVQTGEYWTLLLLADGTVWSQGNDYFGELGDGPGDQGRWRALPLTTSDGTPIDDAVDIAASYDNGHVVLSTGQLLSWGYSDEGELAIDGLTDPQVDWPTETVVTDAVRVVTSSDGLTVFAVLRDGTTLGWGYNDSGQAGVGDTVSTNVPRVVWGVGEDVAKLAGNRDHALVMDGAAPLTVDVVGGEDVASAPTSVPVDELRYDADAPKFTQPSEDDKLYDQDVLAEILNAPDADELLSTLTDLPDADELLSTLTDLPDADELLSTLTDLPDDPDNPVAQALERIALDELPGIDWASILAAADDPELASRADALHSVNLLEVFADAGASQALVDSGAQFSVDDLIIAFARTLLSEVSITAQLLGFTPLGALNHDPAGCNLFESQGFTNCGGEIAAPITDADGNTVPGASLIAAELAGLDAGPANLGEAPYTASALADAPISNFELDQLNLLDHGIGGITIGELDNPDAVCPGCDPSLILLDAVSDPNFNGEATIGDIATSVEALGFNLLQVVRSWLPASINGIDQIDLERLGVEGYRGPGSVTNRIDITIRSRPIDPNVDVQRLRVDLPAGSWLVSDPREITVTGPLTGGVATSITDLDGARIVDLERDGFELVLPRDTGQTRAAEPTLVSFLYRPGVTLIEGVPHAQLTVAGATVDAAPPNELATIEANEPDSADAPTTLLPDRLYLAHIGTAGDEDFYALDLDAGDQATVFLSHVPLGQDYDLAVYAEQPLESGRPLRDVSGSDGRQAMADGGYRAQSGDASVPQLTEDIDLLDRPLVNISATRGDSDEFVQINADHTGQYLVHVIGYLDAHSSQPYTLRAVRSTQPGSGQCITRDYVDTLPFGGGQDWTDAGIRAPQPADVDTLFLVNRDRLVDIHGADATDAMLTALDQVAARDDVNGWVLPVEYVPPAGDDYGAADVRSAWEAWDTDPCSVSLANDVVRAVNAHVDALVADTGIDPSYLVVVGGDEAMPFGRVKDQTTLVNEFRYASALRRPDGLATPNLAAALQGWLLSDDVYTALAPVPVPASWLYIPDLVGGRLAETPAEIQSQLEAFDDPLLDGQINDGSTFTTGYSFFTDAADRIHEAVQQTWSGTAVIRNDDGWNAQDVRDALAGSDPLGSDQAHAVALNGHTDHDSIVTDGGDRIEIADLVGDGTLGSTAGLDPGDVIFSIGCHAGQSLADALYGDAGADLAQTAGGALGSVYVAQTGYGLATNVAPDPSSPGPTTQFTEELTARFAEHLDGATVGQALLLAKQNYLNDTSVLTVFDLKTLQQMTIYGMPHWQAPDSGQQPPEPTPQGTFSENAVLGTFDAVTTSVTPTFDPRTSDEGAWFEGGAGVISVPGQPVLPRERVALAVPDGREADVHDVLITDLASVTEDGFDPLVAVVGATGIGTGDGLSGPTGEAADLAFPSRYAETGRIRTTTGEYVVANLVTGRFAATDRVAARAVGQHTRFTSVDVAALVSDSGDVTRPTILGADAVHIGNGQIRFEVTATDDSGIAPSVGLVLYQDGADWEPAELALVDGVLQAVVPAPADLPTGEDPRYFVQVPDHAGNVAVAANKGQLLAVTGAVTAEIVGSESPEPGVYLDASVVFDVPVGVDVETSLNGDSFVPLAGDTVVIPADRRGTHTLVWQASNGQSDTIEVTTAGRVAAYARQSDSPDPGIEQVGEAIFVVPDGIDVTYQVDAGADRPLGGDRVIIEEAGTHTITWQASIAGTPVQTGSVVVTTIPAVAAEAVQVAPRDPALYRSVDVVFSNITGQDVQASVDGGAFQPVDAADPVVPLPDVAGEHTVDWTIDGAAGGSLDVVVHQLVLASVEEVEPRSTDVARSVDVVFDIGPATTVTAYVDGDAGSPITLDESDNRVQLPDEPGSHTVDWSADSGQTGSVEAVVPGDVHVTIERVPSDTPGVYEDVVVTFSTAEGVTVRAKVDSQWIDPVTDPIVFDTHGGHHLYWEATNGESQRIPMEQLYVYGIVDAAVRYVAAPPDSDAFRKAQVFFDNPDNQLLEVVLTTDGVAGEPEQLHGRVYHVPDAPATYELEWTALESGQTGTTGEFVVHGKPSANPVQTSSSNPDVLSGAGVAFTVPVGETVDVDAAGTPYTLTADDTVEVPDEPGTYEVAWSARESGASGVMDVQVYEAVNATVDEIVDPTGTAYRYERLTLSQVDGVDVDVSIDGGPYEAAPAGGIVEPPLSHGTHTIAWRATTDTGSVTDSTTVEVVGLVTPTVDGTTTLLTGTYSDASVTFAVPEGVTVDVEVDGGPSRPVDGPVEVPTSEGEHDLYYTASTGQTGSLAVAIDATGPSIDIVSPIDGTTVEWGDVQTAAFSCRDGASGVVACDGTVDDGVTFTPDRGEQTFTVTATDAAGNTSTRTITYVVDYDLVSDTLDAGGRKQVLAGTTQQVEFELFDHAGERTTVNGTFAADPVVRRQVDCVTGTALTTWEPAGDDADLRYVVDRNLLGLPIAGTGRFSLTWTTSLGESAGCLELAVVTSGGLAHGTVYEVVSLL